MLFALLARLASRCVYIIKIMNQCKHYFTKKIKKFYELNFYDFNDNYLLFS